jgi:hypothetical protein
VLRFVRQHCLKNQCGKREECTGNAKKLVAANLVLRFARRHCLKGQRKRTAVDAVLRFARRHCLKRQHRKEDRCTGNAKKLIRQLTAALRGEHERVQDQLMMEMRSEKAAQSAAKATGVWEYTPCYLAKHVGDREVHTLTCANTGCTEIRYDKPCRKHAGELRLFCSRVCKDAVCTATGLRVKDLRWVHDHHHSLEVEGGKDPRVEHGGGRESPNN